MELLNLIKKRRSVRRFQPGRKVTDDEIKTILEAGRWAPSSKNSQCWRFYIVKKADIKHDLANKATRQPFIAEADVVIVVAADLARIERYCGQRGVGFYALQDAAAAIQNMLLMITDMGLAACWIGAFNDEKVSEILNLKDNLKPIAMLPVGYPAEEPKAPPRLPLDEITVEIA